MTALRRHALLLARIIVVLAACVAAWWLLRAPDDADELAVLPTPDKPRFESQGLVEAPAPISAGMVEILVNLDDDRDELEGEIEDELGIELRLNSEHADDDNLFVASVPAALAATLQARLDGWDGVEHAELNGRFAAFGGKPNDPLYTYQWNFEQVHAEPGWELADGAGVVVAVIDTGVAFEDSQRKRGILVPDLKGTKLARGYDFVDDDEHPYDQQGHGTHVAGTIAQATNNDYGVAGLAHAATIMPVRVLDAYGSGTWADVADGIRYAADHGAKVINLSLGGGGASREVESAVRYAYDKGVVVVAAAGNNGSRAPSYPAAFDHVIAVAATQYDRSTTFYSNYGPHLDIAAPGGNVLVDQNKDGKPDGILQETLRRERDGRVVFEPTFALYMGTSMACPHVAAAAALVVQSGVSHPDAVAELLTRSAADAGDEGWDEHYGHGILDVGAALRRHIVEEGSSRLLAALLVAGLVLFVLSRKRALERRPGVFFALGWALGAGLFFALPLILGGSGWLAPIAVLSKSVLSWDQLLAAPGAQSPFTASALPALAAVALLLGRPRGAHFAAGLALALAAVLGVEAVRASLDVAWVPGIGWLDRAWLALNAALSLCIGYFALKRP